MSRLPSRGPSRREFLIFGSASAAAVAFAGSIATHTSAGAVTSCDAGACTPATLWMLDPDWGYPRGPHAKTGLVSRASRAAAANRVARTEQDALDMNLHQCSWAPAVEVSACATRVDPIFAEYAADWVNPWSGATVSLLDIRHLPADQELFDCPVSAPIADPPAPSNGGTGGGAGGSANGGGFAYPGTVGELAFTGDSDRRLLFVGAGAVVAGALLRALGGKATTPAHEIESVTDD